MIRFYYKVVYLWKRKKEKGKAFTLSEVLITLAIIGIVAAMTLPTLIRNIQDRQFKVKFKQSISVISQAMKTVYAESDETYTSTDWLQMPIYFCKLEKVLKVMNSGIDCTKVNDDIIYKSWNEWPKDSVRWHAKDMWYDKNGNPQFLNSAYLPLTMDLINGTRINFNCSILIFVDVNGDKGPNTIGRDIYTMKFEDGATSPSLSLNKNFHANECSAGSDTGNSTPLLNSKNYVEDCLHGSGWGCSFMLN